jgi:uncharacterized protein (TIGR00725 family)
MQASAPIIGIMGGGSVSRQWRIRVETLGQRIAEEGWILLNGGRNAGVMEASARGARSRGGLTVGILPDEDTGRMSDYIDIPILTGMGNARNVINVLSSRVVVACAGGAGTASEVAIAVKCNRPVILFGFDPGTLFAEAEKQGRMFREREAEAVVERIRSLLKGGA